MSSTLVLTMSGNQDVGRFIDPLNTTEIHRWAQINEGFSQKDVMTFTFGASLGLSRLLPLGDLPIGKSNLMAELRRTLLRLVPLLRLRDLV